MPSVPSTVAQHRLKWKCQHRLLELDIVLERFLRDKLALTKRRLAC
jgi:succinate dehydrogenase flavin-adding protein (antitoxin of CptAB toxin-antitoxin module)